MGKELYASTESSERVTSMSRNIISGILCVAERAKEIKILSINFMYPVQSYFPLVATQPYRNIYKIFQFDCVHHIPLGLSRMLHECLVGTLADAKPSDAGCTISHETDPKLIKIGKMLRNMRRIKNGSSAVATIAVKNEVAQDLPVDAMKVHSKCIRDRWRCNNFSASDASHTRFRRSACAYVSWYTLSKFRDDFFIQKTAVQK